MARKTGASALKWILIILLLGAAAWGGWWYWKRPGEKPPEYRTASVTRGDLVQSVTASGQLNPVVNVQIGSQISGIIQQLYADFNSIVTQGQVIAVLDPATYRAAVNQADGELANAKAGLELAQVDARRAGELLQSKLLAQSEHDKAQATLHQAEAQVKIRAASLERAQVDFDRCTIYAPTNGIVISRNVDVGQTVAASLSAPTLFVIANDLKRMQIDAMVSEADIGGVEVGQTVNFTVDAFPTRAFQGKVMQIRNSPATNQNVVTYDAVVLVENRDQKLKPGMTANVSIITAEREGILKMPNAALRFRPADAGDGKGLAPAMSRGGGGGGSGSNRIQSGQGGGRRQWGEGGSGGSGRPRPERIPTRTVYTVASTNEAASADASKLQPRQVKVGISDGTFSEVSEGLNEGDLVVIGMNTPEPPRTGGPGAPANPFGGGGGMRRF
jgi:HlyD family secretion protein